MPRYVIERIFDDVDDELMDELGKASKAIVARFPELRWEHSHVVVDAEGNTKSFCIYEAPNTDPIHKHAEELGHHKVVAIFEIGADVHPEEIPD